MPQCRLDIVRYCFFPIYARLLALLEAELQGRDPHLLRFDRHQLVAATPFLSVYFISICCGLFAQCSRPLLRRPPFVLSSVFPIEEDVKESSLKASRGFLRRRSVLLVALVHCDLLPHETERCWLVPRFPVAKWKVIRSFG